MFLSETLAHRHRVEEIRVRLNFDCCFAVDCTGRSGGICIMWKSEVTCTLLGYSRNHIDMKVEDPNGDWRLTGFYGFLERRRRRNSWDLLRQLSSSSPLPWAIIGDFNDLLNTSDKKGRADHPNWLFRGFRKAVLDSGIEDLPLIGHQFTWSRSLGTINAVEERLDRGMVNKDWLDRYPNAYLKNTTTPISNHNPIVLITETLAHRLNVQRRFRFENKWYKEESLPHIVRDCWTNLKGVDVLEKLNATSESLMTWARHLNESNKLEKKMLERKIQNLAGRNDAGSIHAFLEAKRKLAELLHKEKIHWQQRAKKILAKGWGSQHQIFACNCISTQESEYDLEASKR